MTELICTVCPRGCRLKVDEKTLKVTGNACARGDKYGRDEVTSPVRTLTSTVAVSGGLHARLSVRTDKAVPKAKLFECMEHIHALRVKSPVKIGEVLIKNIAGTGADLIATRDI